TPPSPLCPYCLSRTLNFEALSGLGTVYSYTVNVQAWNPTFEHPYVIAVIELEEQDDLRLVSNIYGCAPDDVHIDMPVEVFFESFEDVWLPFFRPISAGVAAHE
ncbi:MAG: putative OB-fold protein, partial [Bacteroidia bacterium]